jgi:DNA-binding XRE family transcriptional regulator
MNGKQLKEKRISLKISQKRLAEIMQIDIRTIGRWENGLIKIPYLAVCFIDGCQIIKPSAAPEYLQYPGKPAENL